MAAPCHAIRCRPGQRGGRPTLNICHGPVSAILVHGVDRRQQSGLRRTAAFNGECLVQMGMGFHRRERQLPPVLQAGSRLVGWGQWRSGRRERPVRQQRLTVTRVGQPSGSARAGSRRG